MAAFFEYRSDIPVPPPPIRYDMGGHMDATRPRRYFRHDLISAPGTPASHVYLIRRGWARLSFDASSGRALTLAILGPGQMFGETEVLYDMRRQHTLVALTPCEVQCIGADRFKRALKDDPAMLEQLLHRLTLRMRWTEAQMQRIASHSVAARLAHVLLSLAGDTPEPAPIPVRLTHHDLATLIASTRETVTATLGDFRRLRLVDFDRTRLCILDRCGLASI